MATDSPRRILSAAATVSIVAPDSTSFLTRPSEYKGNQTFSALMAVKNSIPSSGGWAQLPGTTLRDAYLTNAQIDAISPSPVLRGTQSRIMRAPCGVQRHLTGTGSSLALSGIHYAYWAMTCIPFAWPGFPSACLGYTTRHRLRLSRIGERRTDKVLAESACTFFSVADRLY